MTRLWRTWCRLMHQRKWVRTTGLGWHGRRCPTCGYSFFDGWTDGAKAVLRVAGEDLKPGDLVRFEGGKAFKAVAQPGAHSAQNP